jgi:hypothetical protein
MKSARGLKPNSTPEKFESGQGFMVEENFFLAGKSQQHSAPNSDSKDARAAGCIVRR